MAAAHQGVQLNTDLPYCYMTTAGRVSGRDHEIEIWFAGDDDALYLISGGQNGSDWVRNLRASGQARVRVGDEVVDVTARLPLEKNGTEGAARARAIDALYDKYGDQVSGTRVDWHRDAFIVALDLTDDASN